MSAVQQGIAYLKRDIDRKKAIISDLNAETAQLQLRMQWLDNETAITVTNLQKLEETLKALEGTI